MTSLMIRIICVNCDRQATVKALYKGWGVCESCVESIESDPNLGFGDFIEPKKAECLEDYKYNGDPRNPYW
jgi:hypothetical protein